MGWGLGSGADDRFDFQLSSIKFAALMKS